MSWVGIVLRYPRRYSSSDSYRNMLRYLGHTLSHASGEASHLLILTHTHERGLSPMEKVGAPIGTESVFGLNILAKSM